MSKIIKRYKKPNSGSNKNKKKLTPFIHNKVVHCKETF